MYSDSDDSDNDEDVNFDDTEEEKCSKESMCDENCFDEDLSRTCSDSEDGDDKIEEELELNDLKDKVHLNEYSSQNLNQKVVNFGKEAMMIVETVEDNMNFLSQESLAKAILRPCCSKHCLQIISPKYKTLNFEPVLQILGHARKTLVGHSIAERAQILKQLIQRGMLSNSSSLNQRMRVVYKLEDYNIYRFAFCNAYNITNHLRKKIVGEIKSGMLLLSNSRTSSTSQFNSKTTITDSTVGKVKQMLKQSKITLSPSMSILFQLPNSVAIGKSRAWLTHHFKISGDCDPTSDEIHVDKVDLKDIFAEYKEDMQCQFSDNGRAVLSYSRFCWLI
mmetsp:Transcript_9710/g.13364  ORF Transcript_9710/g.13364 Transcript_9710/m.13364 type:complete len:334 (+) Transcript_9710:50-1051(+)